MKATSKNIDVNGYAFPEIEIEGFRKTKEDFINGKTTAKDWVDIENELNSGRNLNREFDDKY